MHKKLSRLVEPNMQPYFLCLALFVGVTFFFQPVAALGELAAALLLYIFYCSQRQKRRRNLSQYLEMISGGESAISMGGLLQTPLPAVVFQAESGEIIWANDAFLNATADKEKALGKEISAVVPAFSYQWILDGDAQSSDLVEMENSLYRVYGSASRTGGRSGRDQIVTAYFVDSTESQHLKAVYEATRPVVCVLVLDNYEELMKAGGEAAKSAVLAQIDERLNLWVQSSGGLLRKYDRDRYLFICEEQCFEWMVADKFSVLETIHQVVSEDEVIATLSIGIGKDCDTYEESYSWANKAIEMALSRGGDQAVVKDSLDFQFYGGRAKSTEKRTKVKSRVMARALGDLIADSSQVYVMGHEYADMDAVGAAAGVCCIARKLGKKVQVVINLEDNNARALVRKLQALPEYAGVFVSGSDAFLHAQASALLVVVDTNRPDMVESRQLLDSCNRVAVIDHHRRAATYIESAALNFHEPYASSAAELVTELLQYLADPGDLLRQEADALLAGIVLDTKNFTMRTGGRTFEAAAFLRRAGADTAEVRRYFQSDLPSMIQRYDIIRSAQIYRDGIAIAKAETEVARVTAAKAADDLLTLQGIQASFVLYRVGTGVSLSARSLGEVNVQIILEQLGGGGNSTTAGGTIPEANMDEVYSRLTDAIDHYYQQ